MKNFTAIPSAGNLASSKLVAQILKFILVAVKAPFANEEISI